MLKNATIIKNIARTQRYRDLLLRIVIMDELLQQQFDYQCMFGENHNLDHPVKMLSA